ncbi:MAG: pilus assembly protein, partial [Desulfobacca sp.]|nr:pilus assembly protein [Desulfobacca sp.]
MKRIGKDFLHLLDLILSTLQVDELLTTVIKEIQGILGADRCTLYLLDSKNQSLSSKVLQADNLIDIIVPVSKKSLSGYSAVTQKILNIHDAYDQDEITAIDPELIFDKSWDAKSGYRTRSVLVVPIPGKVRGQLIGVFQALNKPAGFSNSDQKVMKNMAYLLGIAIHNALLYQ